MKNLRKSFTMLLLAITSTTFAATPSKNLILVNEGTDNDYEDYKIFVDKSSIKKVKSDTVLFNIVTSGLSLDESITYEEPVVSEQSPDLQNQDGLQVVIVTEMKCNSKELRPLKYTQMDYSTGKVKEQTPPQSESNEGIGADYEILDSIYKIVC
ncbi:hypothetical protein HYG89_11770 [Acinetobacter sp. SwsAc5]|uniref:hypothetical protein n=1 Tax=Acinetobacter sp. SwsAc5 TaxID=2749438 RepID=UPI0015C16187|nr:hypothetical protein [Acinetobacter sp. SwsAc5]NWK53211.1 hypothetical protein [Acinetobacter sp. SwsAc5]